MKRKIDALLSNWKASNSAKPLVLLGARQTGKTTSVLAFAKKEFASVVHIDFYKQPRLKTAFEGNLDPASIVRNLEALLQRDINPADTLLFFDEIQECDAAITSLKYFCTDAPEYRLVAAGSLLGVHVARSGSFPVGYVEIENMHPMDFEEFCWAVDQERAFELVRESMTNMTPCVLHDSLLDLYRTYLMIGGMPEVVLAHANGKGFSRVRKIQEDIRTAYVADMAKYATSSDSAKIAACWDSVPSQLAKESGSTKFLWKDVAKGAKAERYGSAVDWLVSAGVVAKCTQVTDGVSPLKSFENPTSFKLYMTDTGLLSCAYDAVPDDLTGTDHRSARFRGGLAENYVMQQLVASSAQPYYWGSQSTHEVEFVLKLADGVIPVEVKSGSNVRSKSALYFANKYECPYIIRVSTKNFGSENNIHSIPLYAAGLIA